MTTFKPIRRNDVTSTRTLLHEAIPITSSIISGTYGQHGSQVAASFTETNIKNYSHRMFQSVYDYPFLSSSANHIFDISAGYHENASVANSSQTDNSKKVNMYNQFAQLCMGYDSSGAIQKFDKDGNISSGGAKMEACIFISFARLLIKDEIKKGSFELKLSVNSAYLTADNKKIKITDFSGSNGFKTNSPVGEYGILYAEDFSGTTPIHADVKDSSGRVPVGHIYYQAGICVLTASVFQRYQPTEAGILHAALSEFSQSTDGSGADDPSNSKTAQDTLKNKPIEHFANYLRTRIDNISFNNTTELNSTIYFCRVNHNDFNYSTNPTYLNSSKIRVKQDRTDAPVSYITTVGLYSSDGALLAVGKLSEPLKKAPDVEYTLRARLDY